MGAWATEGLPSVQETLPLPYGRGSQKCPRRASLSGAVPPPPRDRSSPTPTADSSTSSTVRNDSSEARRFRAALHRGVGEGSTGTSNRQGGRKQQAAIMGVKPTLGTTGLPIETLKHHWERAAFLPNGLQPDSLLCLLLCPWQSRHNGEELLLLEMMKCCPLRAAATMCSSGQWGWEAFLLSPLHVNLEYPG